MTIDWASESPYGVAELLAEVDGYRNGSLVKETEIKCCVADCPHWLRRRRRGQTKSDGLFCPIHGISVSTTPTYIFQDYWRNFIIGRDLLKSVTKVESWRLGNETSEDAVSWNVFVGLQKSGGLRECFELLTGITGCAEPELYLWGNRIAEGQSLSVFDKLREAREKLESQVGIPTEPDIMLRIPGQAIVLIEAKFGSPNGRFAGKEGRFGGIQQYLARYHAKTPNSDPLNREWIAKQEPEKILEQLCRNVVFAHWLASDGEKPFVINLVDVTSQPESEDEFRRHLRENNVTFFRRTWDDICHLPTIGTESASQLRTYLVNKTVHLRKAFKISGLPSV